MELFDELDENGWFTGRTVERHHAHTVGAWHRALSLYIVNKRGQVLLQKRSITKKTWGGCWDAPVAGHVDAGELGLACVIREAHEELGIKINPDEIRYICCRRSDMKTDKLHDRHFNEYYVAFKNLDASKLKLEPGEVDEVKWVDFADFKRMVEKRDDSLSGKWASHEALIRYVESNP